jgi:hypothetical protein
MSENSGWDDYDYQQNTGELGDELFDDDSSENSGWKDYDYQQNTGELGDGMFDDNCKLFNDNSPFLGCLIFVALIVLFFFVMCS